MSYVDKPRNHVLIRRGVSFALVLMVVLGKRYPMRNLPDLCCLIWQILRAKDINTEQQRGLEAQNQTNQFGLTALANQMQAGQLQRDIEQQGISADRLQFEEERDYPYKQVQYQQSLLQGLPIGAQSYNYAQPSTLSEFMSGTGGTYDLLSDLFGVGPTDAEKLAAARALVAANATNVAAIATT